MLKKTFIVPGTAGENEMESNLANNDQSDDLEVTQEDAQYRIELRRKICCGDT